MPSIRTSRPRHKLSDIKAVYAALAPPDPRTAQERLMTDLRRRAVVGDGADLALSSCPLDTMKARQVRGVGELTFTDEHHKVGEWFLVLYRYRNGGCKLKGALDDGARGGEAVDKPRHDAEWLAMATDRRMGDGRVNLLANAIVWHVQPPWLSHIIAGTDHGIPDEQAEFMASLEALRVIWLEFGRESTETLRAKYERQRAC